MKQMWTDMFESPTFKSSHPNYPASSPLCPNFSLPWSFVCALNPLNQALWHYTKLSMGEQIKSVELKSEMAEKEQSNGTTWMLYVLLLSDHRNLPLDCGDPPTMFDVKWIDQSKAVILGAAKYTVVDKITDGDD
ncbi:unnamed protein product [Calicophoron daubneyi]|uniref:Uncharacterized protein n=1 Tax=Calicophoron daubneyi TaxID=300641 RepID=A0AAV2T189_CALDB